MQRKRSDPVFWFLFSVLLSAQGILVMLYVASISKVAEDVRTIILITIITCIIGLFVVVGIYGSECYDQGRQDATPPEKG